LIEDVLYAFIASLVNDASKVLCAWLLALVFDGNLLELIIAREVGESRVVYHKALSLAADALLGDILIKVWGEAYYGEEKIVDVNIRRLRMKIEEDPSKPKNLVTVWGMGYKWNTAE
jgi:hypothetical protein